MGKKRLSGIYGTQDGGVIFRIISAFTTLLLIGVLLYSLIQSYQQKGGEYHRKAIELSEYGMLLTLQKINSDPSWGEGFKETAYENGSYCVEMRKHFNDDTIFMTIISKGQICSVTEERQIVLRLQVTSGDSSWIPNGIH